MAISSLRGAQCCRVLLESGADVGRRDRVGRTPLHIAAEANDPAVLALLLSKYKAAVDAQDMVGLYWWVCRVECKCVS